MGFYCPNVAADLLAADEDLYIYGPTLMNSEVLVSKKNMEEIKVVGYASNRHNLFSRLTEFDLEYEGIEINKGIRYFVEKNEIDGAIIDLNEFVNYPGYMIYPISREDYISYVLVVRDGVESKEEFEVFIKSYNEVVKKLQSKSALADRLGIDMDIMKDIFLLELEVY